MISLFKTNNLDGRLLDRTPKAGESHYRSISRFYVQFEPLFLGIFIGLAILLSVLALHEIPAIDVLYHYMGLGFDVSLLTAIAALYVWMSGRSTVKPVLFSLWVMPLSSMLFFTALADNGGVAGQWLHYLLYNFLQLVTDKQTALFLIMVVSSLMLGYALVITESPVVNGMRRVMAYVASAGYLIGDPDKTAAAEMDVVEEKEAVAAAKRTQEHEDALLQILHQRKIPAQSLELTDSYRYEIANVRLPNEFDVEKLTKQKANLERITGLKPIGIAESVEGQPGVSQITIPKDKSRKRDLLLVRDILETPEFHANKQPMTMAFAKDIYGKTVYKSLRDAPHLLVAGTTGAGKSVEINAMIISLMASTPVSDLGFIMIDPKMLELNIYERSPYMMMPVITDMSKAMETLDYAINEMEYRYQLMSDMEVRNLKAYNTIAGKRDVKNKVVVDPNVDTLSDAAGEYHRPLKNIVIVIDEFADMIMVCGKEVEQAVARLAQKARAAGIHIIMGTQRPDKDVVTGLIKANITSVVAMSVSNATNSRIIMDENGAESLTGEGDQLIKFKGENKIRAQGAYIDEKEIAKIIKAQNKTKLEVAA